MRLDQLLLRKEELPILNDTRFTVPIHPGLLRKENSIDPNLAQRLFPQAAQEWYADLQAYTETVQDEGKQKWYKEVFLKEGIQFGTHYERQTILEGTWEDLVQTDKIGFAHVLSINRNAGGSLYFNEGDMFSCNGYISPPLVNFTPEKFDAYAVHKFPDCEGVVAHAYGHHNIDYYPGALFLRNWAILYLNEAMKEVVKQNVAKGF
ncbi:MAG: hypothetical protein Q7S55_03430 [Nanoarchaeota archaeon]|nr:hypothetical protein [Nanoarchaeota archaeon]